MNIAVLLILLGIVLFIAVFGVGYLILGAPKLTKRLQLDSQQDQNETPKDWRSFFRRYEKVVKPLGELVPRSPEEMSRQERRLAKAGIRRKDGPMLLNGAKFVLAIIFAIIFTTTGWMFSNPILYVALSILLGAMLPDLWIARKIANRTDKIQLALPNALDLAVVCVEAGMGLDQALMRIGQEMKKGFPELSDELNVLGLEINAGRKRADALRNLGNRTNSQDLKSFIAVLIQTDRFGTSVAQSLRVFSDSMRTTRRLRAEEHAAKMSVKMIPALVLFIFPAMIIVVLGPAIIAIIRQLVPALISK